MRHDVTLSFIFAPHGSFSSQFAQRGQLPPTRRISRIARGVLTNRSTGKSDATCKRIAAHAAPLRSSASAGKGAASRRRAALNVEDGECERA
jgi:hypothetical protein